MEKLLDFVLGLGLFGMVTSTIYTGLAMLAVWRFIHRGEGGSAAVFEPPVSLLKPLHGAEPDLEAHLATFFQQDYPQYEILFCARHADDAGLVAARKVAAGYPQVPVQFLASGEPTVPNAKILSLELMAHAAQHELLIISDSDVRVDRDYVREVVAPFSDPHVGAVTCMYRGVAGQGGLWSRIEAAAMSIEMSAGVLVADMMEGMKFALGPTMAIRRACLEEFGGFLPMGEYCADDFLLGNWVAERGHAVVLSRHVIDHVVLHASFWPIYAAPGPVDEEHAFFAAQGALRHGAYVQCSVRAADCGGALWIASAAWARPGGSCAAVERRDADAAGPGGEQERSAGEIRVAKRAAVSGSRPAGDLLLDSQLLQP